MKFNTILPSFFMAASVAVATSLPAQALTFDFSGSDKGGTGSATMNFTGLGTKAVSVDLFNTSSTTLNNGTGVNAPAITKFGFNYLGEPDPKLLSWELKAFDSNKQFVTIGSSSDKKLPWSINFDEKFGNISLDYMAETKDVKGGIYNPNATAGLAAKPNFFSKATLSLNFGSNFTLDKASTFVRMQNVGLKGDGSLKLTGTEKPPTEDVPEPLTILGSAAALGFGSIFKKQADKNKNKAAHQDKLSV